MNNTIEIIRYPNELDWQRCKILALNTVGKKSINSPDHNWKIQMLKSEHSPIRTLMFTIKMEVPYWVSVHFSRHKFGVEHFVTSQRNDRQINYDRNQAIQSQYVTHIMDINAQELMFIARKRLCKQASEETRDIMQKICKKIIELCPEFEDLLVPNCVYRGGLCFEFNKCKK